MRRQLHSRLLRDRNHFFQESLQPPPQFFVGDRRYIPGRRLAVIDHVPDRSVRNGHFFGGTIHSQCYRASTTERSSDASAHPRQTEVVAEHWNSRFAEAANDGLNFFDLLRALRAVKQDIVPVRGVEVFDRRENQPGIFNILAKTYEFGHSPKLVGVSSDSPGLVFRPAWLIVSGVGGTLIEIIHQMNHHVRAACLARKVVIIARQHVTVQPKTDLHKRFPMPAP